MKIEIELGYSHWRDALALINEALVGQKFINDSRSVSLQHLRDAIAEAPAYKEIDQGIAKARKLGSKRGK